MRGCVGIPRGCSSKDKDGSRVQTSMSDTEHYKLASYTGKVATSGSGASYRACRTLVHLMLLAQIRALHTTELRG
jgi:hypothetical protein